MLGIYDVTSFNELTLSAPVRQMLQHMPEAIRNASSRVTLRKDSILVKANDPSDYVYLVLSGRMEALAEYSSGINYSFTEFTAFDIIGEMEAITGDSHYAVTIKAQTTCKTICMSKETFLDWMRQSPDASFTLCQLVTKKLFSQIKTDRNFLFLDAIDRFVLHLIACYQKRSVDSTLFLKSTRQQIADEIGFCTKTVNRCVKRLSQKGYLTLERNKIVVSKEQYEKLTALNIRQSN
ncbi:Crp/Fnr family transcriptional regulator [Pelosinus sp. IPA-1]|uniref:Crp/Fnr family transcriptional regulator n=1 Tax=Pelosinus sp. IPA-1 TaxID=3029569 RepID=UPI00243617E0|nr:Crp/Fnr family transcriptional regulator [Pelosinus sp. IPA-1]GMA97955.1 Crp/Fnr family transcriptional regulator [Pelosinus sp. IPA-1]